MNNGVLEPHLLLIRNQLQTQLQKIQKISKNGVNKLADMENAQILKNLRRKASGGIVFEGSLARRFTY